MNDEQLTGALIAVAVVLLSAGASLLLALFVNHSDRIRHEADAKADERRHEELKTAIERRDVAINALIRSHGRHDGEISDHAEVLTDHAEKLDALLPGTRAARPRPRV